MNRLIPTSHFSKLLRNKKKEGSLAYIVVKVEQAVELMQNSPNPEALGEKKAGELGDFYAYKLNDSSRILYRVQRTGDEVSVILDRVCNHKQNYG